jgi:putative OPT family oligopeptide transporter
VDSEISTQTGLPENAYRELNEGEEYQPVLSPKLTFPEVTPWSVFLGLFMAVIFSAACAYSGLKIGQVFEAAIPISIIAVGASALARKKDPLGQNVIIQSIGASSGVIVAGAVFTIPALYILELNIDFFKIFFASFLGGCLGILFLIPFRKYFVKDMHGKFPFPEATATTEILIAGEKGGSHAGVLIAAGLVGGIYDFLFSYFHLWAEVFTSRVVGFGAAIAEKAKIVFSLNISSLIVGFGYLIGLKYATIIVVGSLISWWVFIPLINQIGDIAASMGGTNIFAAMAPEMIFRNYVKFIGIGAIAMAGLIGIVKSSKIIGGAFSLAFKGIFGGKHETSKEDVIRSQRDIPMNFIILFIALTIVAIFIFLAVGFEITITQAIVALLSLVIISFLFTTVAANAIAIVGTNPVSGMTLMTLILSSLVLVQVGLTGNSGMESTLIIGGIVCSALSMSGGFITDLKIGYWIGSTPMKQERWKFLGTLVSAATVGVVIFMLNSTYGFTPKTAVEKEHLFTTEQLHQIDSKTADSVLMNKYNEALAEAKPLVAPQANAMAAVIKPLMSPGAQIHWMLYFCGAMIALLLNFLGIPPLAFALGMFIPLDLNTPLIIGGLIAHFIGKSSKNPKLAEARTQRGTLIMSGFIAGAALFGVMGAVLRFLGAEYNTEIFAKNSVMPEIIAIIMFAILVIYAVWQMFKAKVED